MEITELIKQQIFECVVMFAAGTALGLLYQLFCGIRIWVRQKGCQAPAAGWLSSASEVVFWVLASKVVSGFLYRASYGELSFHNFLFLGLGVLLWKKAFYDIVYSS